MQRPRLDHKTKIWNFLNVQATYTQDVQLMGGGDRTVYNDSDWAVARSSINFYQKPTPSTFINLYFSGSHQLKAAMELIHRVDFTSVKNIGEIGGVPFRQLITVLNINPHLKFLATDFDIASLNIFKNEFSKFRKLEFKSGNVTDTKIEFARIFLQGEFKQFDVITMELSMFDSCDLIMMWGVDYALGDVELRKLLSYIKKNKISLIIGTLTPMKFSLFLVESLMRNHFLRKLFGKKDLNFRLHGYFRSHSYFKEIAREFNLNSTILFVDDWYSVLQIK